MSEYEDLKTGDIVAGHSLIGRSMLFLEFQEIV
jgi:hypothetical protein